MKELVVISGKGGTGKTSLVASLASLVESKVLADCDVDAADLHLVMDVSVQETTDFVAGREPRIRQDDCIGCGACLARCRFGAVRMDGKGAGDATFTIDPIACEGCGVCVHFCPVKAIDFDDRLCGQWFVSETRHGPMVHAKLGVAQENSGKLVSVVRDRARKIAEERGLEWVVIDGSPGIGCPVIASITGASLVLVVTEPTLSGLHDLSRVVKLAGHFSVPVAVCINKYDLNEAQAGEIEGFCCERGINVVGKVPYDVSVTKAQVAGLSVVEYGEGVASESIKGVWRAVEGMI